MSNNYPTRKLEVIVDFQNGLWTGKTPPFVTAKVLRNTNFKNNDGTLNYDNVAEIEVEGKQLKSRLLQKGDIILERSGGGPDQPVGRVVYFNEENDKYSFSNFTTRIRVNSDTINDKYLWFFLHSFYRSGKTELMQKKTTGIRNLTFSEYKNIEIPLPPLEEQKKIVAKLERVLAKIGEAKKLRAEARENTNNLLSAELHKIFFKQHSNILKNVRMSSTGKNGWEESELQEAVEQKTAKNTKRNLPFVGMEDVESETGRFLGSLEPKSVKSTTFYFDKESVLYGKLRPYLNKVLLPDFEGHCSTEFIPLKPKNGVSRKWIAYWLKSPQIVESAMSTNTGSRMPRANMKDLMKFKIPLPPLAEQKKIVARLDSLSEKIEKIKDLQSQTADDFKTLEQSILHQAFSN